MSDAPAREAAPILVRNARVRPARWPRVIGALAPPAFYDPADFPGRSTEEIVAGLTEAPGKDG